MPGWFDAFRDGDWSAFYDPIRTAASVDFGQVNVLYAWSLITFACTLLIIGTRRSEGFSTFLRMSMAVHVAFSVLLSLVGSDWLKANGDVISWYDVASDQKIEAKVSVHVGLNHVNVSLIGWSNSTGNVHYNERISWWEVHQAEKEYIVALSKGLPIPLMDMEEAFGIGFDQFDINKSLDLRTAGYYTYILLCTGLSFWFITNILIYLVITDAALLFTLTGLVFLLANLVYYLMQPRQPVVIQVEEMQLELTFGWCFYLNLVAGVLTFICGLLILITGRINPAKVAVFFDITNENVLMELKAKKDRPRLEEEETYNQDFELGGITRRSAAVLDGDEETDVDANGDTGAVNLGFHIELDPFRKMSL